MRPPLTPQSQDVPTTDIVSQLGSIRPSHRSRKAQVADFLLRRQSPALTTAALDAATRVHGSRFFAAALAQRGSGKAQSGAGLGRLVLALKPAKGSAVASFDLAQKFADAQTEDVTTLLGMGREKFNQELREALVKSGMGGAKARKCTDVIHAALVAKFATDNETGRLGNYHGKIDAIGKGGTLSEQLEALRSIEDELAAEAGLSDAGIAKIKARLVQLRQQLEPGAALLEGLIASSTKDITTDASPALIETRLSELAMHKSAMSAANLSLETRQHLNDLLDTSTTLLTVLKQRSAMLDDLAGQPHLQNTLRGLDARQYVSAHQGLVHITGNIDPAYKTSLLDRLDELIIEARQTVWITSMQAGDAEIIDMVLAGAHWDQQAWNLKVCKLDRADSLQMLNASAQHKLRIAARELDKVMQSESLKSGILKSMGTKGKQAFGKLPVNAFQALKADARLIGWFVQWSGQHAPAMLGERDLAIANWIRLSLHDPATGKPDAARCKELFSQLGAEGIDTEAIQALALQGFSGTSDVQKCARQIQIFSRALLGNALVASVDTQVRAAQTGLQLLRSIGIEASQINDEGIDAKVKNLLKEAVLHSRGVQDLLLTLRRVAVLQVATLSKDADFKPSGKNAEGSDYASQIMDRLAAMGVAPNAQSPVVKKAAQHALAKLPGDSRNLEQLCAKFAPGAISKIAGAVKRSVVGGNPSVQAIRSEPLTARRSANEAMLKGAVAGLQANQHITIAFGLSGELSVSLPTVPGLNVTADLNAGVHDSIKVSRQADGAFGVEILRSKTGRQGASVASMADIINVSLGITRASDRGQSLAFNNQADCEAFLIALANGTDIAPHLQAARSVQATASSERRGDVSVSATADFTLASLSAEIAASVGERYSVQQNKQFTQEVFSRDVRAEVVLKAALAGDALSAQTGAGISLGVRRNVTRENGMLVGGMLVGGMLVDAAANGLTAGAQEDPGATLNVIAWVVGGNTQRCLDALLPGASPAQVQAIAAQLGAAPEGTELFTRYTLDEAARVQANSLLGKANAALSEAAALPTGPSQDAARAKARDFARQADAVSRDPAHYTPEGFGWTLASGTTLERARGPYTQSASLSAQQSNFVPFEQAATGTPVVGQSLLLAVMA
jgi:hypothetical protein